MKKGTFYVKKNGRLDYDGNVKAGEVYPFTEDKRYLVLHRPPQKNGAVVNIVTMKDEAEQIGELVYN